jgi:GGDEF domain-containing protein
MEQYGTHLISENAHHAEESSVAVVEKVSRERPLSTQAKFLFDTLGFGDTEQNFLQDHPELMTYLERRLQDGNAKSEMRPLKFLDGTDTSMITPEQLDDFSNPEGDIPLILNSFALGLLDQAGYRAFVNLDLTGVFQCNKLPTEVPESGGDYAIRQGVIQMGKLCEPGDVLVRVGGDEFVIYRHQDVVRQVDEWALQERVSHILSEKFRLVEQHGHVVAVPLNAQVKLHAPGAMVIQESRSASERLAEFKQRYSGIQDVILLQEFDALAVESDQQYFLDAFEAYKRIAGTHHEFAPIVHELYQAMDPHDLAAREGSRLITTISAVLEDPLLSTLAAEQTSASGEVCVYHDQSDWLFHLEHRACESGLDPVIAKIEFPATLKALNDHDGYARGDAFITERFALVVEHLQQEYGLGVRMFRRGGDFYVSLPTLAQMYSRELSAIVDWGSLPISDQQAYGAHIQARLENAVTGIPQGNGKRSLVDYVDREQGQSRSTLVVPSVFLAPLVLDKSGTDPTALEPKIQNVQELYALFASLSIKMSQRIAGRFASQLHIETAEGQQALADLLRQQYYNPNDKRGAIRLDKLRLSADESFVMQTFLDGAANYTEVANVLERRSY